MNQTTTEKIAEALRSVLCGPDGKCCIDGSDDDRSIVDEALAQLEAERAAPAEPVPLAREKVGAPIVYADPEDLTDNEGNWINEHNWITVRVTGDPAKLPPELRHFIPLYATPAAPAPEADK